MIIRKKIITWCKYSKHGYRHLAPERCYNMNCILNDGDKIPKLEHKYNKDVGGLISQITNCKDYTNDED